MNWHLLKIMRTGLAMVVVCSSLSGCTSQKLRRPSDPESQSANGDIHSLELEIQQLRIQLESSAEELRILTNAVPGILRPTVWIEAEEARERAYPRTEVANDLSNTKAALERAIRANEAQIRVFKFIPLQRPQ